MKLILTMADDKKQRLYLSNYVPFGAESRKRDQVVEANGKANVGKSIPIAQTLTSRAHISSLYI